MCTYVKMEYIVASALVELCEKKNIRQISLNDIRSYGITVEKHLINNKVDAILLYSDNYTKQFLQDYSDYFELNGENIVIKDNVTVDSIREHILSYISFDILFALFSEESLMAINVA